MKWHDDELEFQEQEIINQAINAWSPQELFPLLDATYLKFDYSENDWKIFAEQGVWENQHVAAYCVQPAYLSVVKQFRPDDRIRLATVANFPEGTSEKHTILLELGRALSAGCDEIDVVFPYSDLLSGKETEAYELIKWVRDAVPCTLKVILETAAFTNPEQLYRTSRKVLDLGADFLKTSTGMLSVGATPAACMILLKAIKDHGSQAGIKLSGGIKTIEQASFFLHMIERGMGRAWVDPSHVRIGASQLVSQLLQKAH